MSRTLTGIRADRKQSYRSIEQGATGLREMLAFGPLDRFDSLRFFGQVVPDMTVTCGSGNISFVRPSSTAKKKDGRGGTPTLRF